VAISPRGTDEEEARQQVFARLALAQCHNNYAAFLNKIGNRTLAVEYLLKARAAYEVCHKGLPQAADFAYLLGSTYYNMAKFLETAAGEAHQGESEYRTALPLLQLAVRSEPDRTKFRALLAMCQYNLGDLLYGAKRGEEAQSLWEASLAEWQQLAERHPESSEYHSRIGATLSNLGVLARDRGDLEVARENLEEALTHQKRALSAKPVYQRAIPFLETHYRVLAKILKAQHDEAAFTALENDRAKVFPSAKKMQQR
jgi:tetratricopeptide (TPR) repeat protein